MLVVGLALLLLWLSVGCTDVEEMVFLYTHRKHIADVFDSAANKASDCGMWTYLMCGVAASSRCSLMESLTAATGTVTTNICL